MYGTLVQYLNAFPVSGTKKRRTAGFPPCGNLFANPNLVPIR
jgi:hypothetical protein